MKTHGLSLLKMLGEDDKRLSSQSPRPTQDMRQVKKLGEDDKEEEVILSKSRPIQERRQVTGAVLENRIKGY